MTISVTAANDASAWDAFIVERGGSPLFLWVWTELAAASQSGEALRLIAHDEAGETLGVAWCLERHRLGLKFGVQPLLTPYAGVWVPESARQGEAHTELIKALQQRMHLLDLQLPVEAAHFEGAIASKFRRNLVIDLHERQAAWEREEFAGLSSSAKRQVKKARRTENLKLDNFIEPLGLTVMTRATFEKRGQRCPISSALIDGLVTKAALKPYRRTLAIYDEGVPASCLILLIDPPCEGGSTGNPRRAYYAHAATDPKYLSTGAASWLVQEGLKVAAEAGCDLFDFCGGNIPGIAKFKEGFGPTEEKVPHLLWSRVPGLLGIRNSLRRS